MPQCTVEQVRQARKSNLYVFLEQNHPELITIESKSIRLIDNHSISIKEDYCGYTDFETYEKGNSIDFLVRYLNYDFVDAVLALCGLSIPVTNINPNTNQGTVSNSDEIKPSFPTPSKEKYKHLFAYLKGRCISQRTIQMLIDWDLLYEESSKHHNIVFANNERDWGEIRGTYTLGDTKFHGIVSNSRRDGFWWFAPAPHNTLDTFYICEAAIDAISLYEIHYKEHKASNAAYISIGGVGKQHTINRIIAEIKSNAKIVLAVDNDNAGQKCRDNNCQLCSIVPVNKDWNEDLKTLKASAVI